MVVKKLNEEHQKNEMQKQFDLLRSAFDSQPKEIQIILSPMIEQLVHIRNIINDTLVDIKKEHNSDKRTEKLKNYSNLTKDYTSIIEKIMKIINDNG